MEREKQGSFRVARLLLSVVLALGLVPVFAAPAMADEGEGDIATRIEVSSDIQSVINQATGSSIEITLAKDIEECIDIPNGATVVINLNGFTLSNGNESEHTIANHGVLEVKGSGSVKNSAALHAALANYPGARATLNGGSFVDNNWYTIKNLGTMEINEGVVVSRTDSASSMIDNGWYGNKDNDLGLASPGSDAEASLIINGGTFSGGMNTVKNDDYGVLQITGGSFSNTSGAVILNWNETTITGGDFVGSSPNNPLLANGYLNSSADKGVFAITGGSFTAHGGTNESIFGYGVNSQVGGEVSISGGNFIGSILPVSAGNQTLFKIEVTGGTVTGTVSGDCMPSGMIQDTTGNIVINEEKAVAKVGNAAYSSLQEAVEAVGEGGTVTLMSNASGNGVKVQSGTNFTLDLGGCTYTVDGETVGSAGTETNGFQLLRDSTITIKNGTITSDKAKILIQNYSNLTLEDVDLIGGEDTQYTLSNNNGDVLIGKDTNIKAGKASPQVAFDVCRFSNYPSVKVTVDEGAGKIVGGIEITASNNDAKEGLSLVVNGGDFSEATVWYGEGGGLATVEKAADVELNNPKGTVATITDENGTIAYFASLQDAINRAEEGDTVSMVGDAAGPIAINKSISVVGNGFTITAESGDAITVTAGGVKLQDVKAVAKTGIALVAGTGTDPVDGVLVEGGRYENVTPGKQGEGAIRIYSGSNAEVSGATTVGGIQVLKADGEVTIAGNTVGFTYEGEVPLVGVLVLKEPGADSNANVVMGSNDISVPNESSFYVQYGIPETSSGSWVFDSDEVVSATGSVAVIDGAYYLTLQNAVDAVADGKTIKIIASCDEDVTVDRKVSFKIEAEDGVSFTGSVKAASGYVVSEKDGIYTVEEYTYVPPASDPAYDVAVSQPENGSVSVEPARAEAGEKVVVTAAPDEGYLVGSVEVADADGRPVEVAEGADGSFSFEMPEGGATVSVTFAWDDPYGDVSPSDWYYPAVEYVTVNGIMKGYAPEFDTFGAYDELTRAQMVQILYNMAGAPAVEYAGTFDDVPEAYDYAEAIEWAASEGIATGFGPEFDSFSPDDPVTREQMAAFMCRYAAWAGEDVSADASVLAAFPDAGEVSAWAVEEMAWAVGSGVINGVGGTELQPVATSVRAYAAQMLTNYLTAK